MKSACKFLIGFYLIIINIQNTSRSLDKDISTNILIRSMNYKPQTISKHIKTRLSVISSDLPYVKFLTETLLN